MKNKENYFKINTPDERYFVWVKRPDIDLRTYLIFNFGEFKSRFADMLDRLGYITVEQVKQLDESDDEMCSLVFSFDFDDDDKWKFLLEDIPAIMDNVLYNTECYD